MLFILSQFVQALKEENFEVAQGVLQYLKGTPGYGVLLQSTYDLQIHAFCDVNGGACPLTRQSITVYLVTLGGSPISWKTKKETIISHSPAEDEYRYMTTTTSELIWLKVLLASVGVFHTSAMYLSCDSQAAVRIAKNLILYERTKHIELDCHFVWEQLKARDLIFSYIHTTQQPADIVTKALGRKQFTYLRVKLGKIDAHAPT